MEWTDTLMLETAPAKTSIASVPAMVLTRVVAIQEITLLCADATSPTETTAALELLRGFRAMGRRVVICDTTRLVVGKQFGSEVVECGAAQMLVSCGSGGREVGIGARDAGLDLASVLVCSNSRAACQVLVNQLNPCDTVLLLGIDSETCGELAASIKQRLSMRSAIAA